LILKSGVTNCPIYLQYFSQDFTTFLAILVGQESKSVFKRNLDIYFSRFPELFRRPLPQSAQRQRAGIFQEEEAAAS
jgi:hypothetical protein